MRITDIRLFKLAVPLKTPFRTALRTVERMESVIVEVHTDTGHIGRGEAFHSGTPRCCPYRSYSAMSSAALALVLCTMAVWTRWSSSSRSSISPPMSRGPTGTLRGAGRAVPAGVRL